MVAMHNQSLLWIHYKKSFFSSHEQLKWKSFYWLVRHLYNLLTIFLGDTLVVLIYSCGEEKVHYSV